MVILFAWLLGGIIGAANRSGGMAALGPLVIGYIKDSFLSQLITFFFGFLIFMDDYGNTLIVGNTIRPITDTMRLSREKLSFLVDCTSAPIASIVPVSTCVRRRRRHRRDGVAEPVPGAVGVHEGQGHAGHRRDRPLISHERPFPWLARIKSSSCTYPDDTPFPLTT